MSGFNWDDHPIVDGPKPGAFNWDDHPVVTSAADSIPAVASGAAGFIQGIPFSHQMAAAGKTGLDVLSGAVPVSDALDEYRSERDRTKKDLDITAAAHPVAGFAGNMASAPFIPLPAGAKGGAIYGGASALSNSDADLTKGEIGKAAGDTALGATAGAVVGDAAEQGAKYISKGLGTVGEYLANKAAALKVKAIGATGKEAARLAPETGRYMLDNKIGGPLSGPAQIADSAQSAMDKSGESISSALSQLSDQGVTVNRNTVLNAIKNKISSLSDNEAQTGLANKLKREAANIRSKITTSTDTMQPPVPVNPGTFANESKFSDLKSMGDELSQRNERAQAANLDSANARGYRQYDPKVVTENADIPISQAEDIKRDYQSKVNWKSPNPDVVANNANTTVSSAYRQAVEDAATEANPEIGAAFKGDKKAYGILAPVQEAAQRRALQLQQSPHGGLLDIASAGAGGSIGATLGGPIGAPIGAAMGYAAKSLRPRYASMGAHSADALSKIIQTSPESLGKYAPALVAAANKGVNSLRTTDKILQQSDPEYRQRLAGLLNRTPAGPGGDQ